MKLHPVSLVLPVIAFGLFALVGAGSARAQATTTTTNIEFPLDVTLDNPCTGEPIAFSGRGHLVIRTTATPSGVFTTTVHSNLQDVSGVGAVSGATFHFQAAGTTTITAAPAQETTIVNDFRVIGPGPGNNFLVHNTTHLTIDANGVATATVDNTFATCR
jgi:hypothetical protein